MTAASASMKLSRDGPIATIEIDNIAKHNAMTLAMWRDLAQCLRTVEDGATRCVVLQGAGTKAFVSGADLSRFEEERSGSNGAQTYEGAVDQAVAAIVDCRLPTIASIGGVCYGGGMMIAAACDFRIASDDSRFCIPAARLGLGYPRKAVQRLVGLVGPANAKMLLMSAQPIDAARALEYGFLDTCVSTGQRHAKVEDLALILAANAPLAVAAAKIAVDHAAFGCHDAGSVDAAVARCALSQDYGEGQAAFAEKRKPQFEGR